MRALGFVLLAFTLSGCAKTLHHSAKTPVATTTKTSETTYSMLLPPASSIRLLSSLTELDGKAFLTLGSVFGEECQVNAWDFPTDMSKVRSQMQASAEKLHANAVILNNCEIIANTSGCYRQTQCRGSALRVAN